MTSDVVVTGTGVLCALGPDTAAFAEALRAGRSGVAARPGGTAPGAPGPVLAADLRDFVFAEAVAARRHMPERLRRGALRTAGRSPLSVQASLAVALEAWESAGLHRAGGAPEPGRAALVVAGHNLGGAQSERVRPKFEADPAYLPPRYALHFQDTDHVGTVSQVLGITGEGCTVGGASASGTVGLAHGARLVASGEADVCLVIGALTELSPMERQAFFNLGAMAGGRGTDRPATRCRPFDRDREGFVPAQAAACLVLESAAHARARDAVPLAGLPGWAVRLDGNSLADPSEDGEARTMSAALARAGLPAERIGYVNTHGTASRLGDETELRALRRVFGPAAGRPWVNATKGLVGHGLCAAGVVEAVATVVQLRGGFVHPNANLECPIDEGIRFAGGRARTAEVEFALSSSFGFGGFNASVVLARTGGATAPDAARTGTAQAAERTRE
ncbi:beta-ketoacyl synthase N-terminal-like domain-containing protein [Streptomyces sp. NPDC058374]|uniref:beta-ketoacyl synthase N-terminal-like domain-containing protein n=1 Tax=unclassified Streptomyces TaxID=2593676 RepID=UPI00365C0E41